MSVVQKHSALLKTSTFDTSNSIHFLLSESANNLNNLKELVKFAKAFNNFCLDNIILEPKRSSLGSEVVQLFYKDCPTAMRHFLYMFELKSFKRFGHYLQF